MKTMLPPHSLDSAPLSRTVFGSLPLILLVVLRFSLASLAQANAQQPLTTAIGNAPTTAPGKSAARLILVQGAAGTTEYNADFSTAAQSWKKLAQHASLQLIDLTGEPKTGGEDQASALHAAIESAIQDGAAPIWLVYLGHATSERGTHKLNLIGPDISAQTLQEWLKPASQPAYLVFCSSSSAPFLPTLSAPGRVVITATRSGTENNYARFGRYLASSILDPTTDIDHDEEVSLLEAFLAAAAQTEKYYREESRLATEHALIDDNGDKLGTGADFFTGTRATKAAQPGKELDGQRAAKVILYSTPQAPRLSAAAKASRDTIETSIAELRLRKASMPSEEYWNQLEHLLLQLADIYQQAD